MNSFYFSHEARARITHFIERRSSLQGRLPVKPTTLFTKDPCMKTFKILTASLLALVSANAFAGETLTNEQMVMRELVAHSGQYTIVADPGTEWTSEHKLSEMIANALVGGYLGTRDNGYMVLNDVSISCEKTVGARGRDELECSVNFMNGDFEVKKDGSLEGPQTESSISFTVPAVIENGKARILSKKLKGFLAG